MKLMEIALGKKPKSEDSEDKGADVSVEAIKEAFSLFEKGEADKAARSLKGAIEACVSDYSDDD